MNIILPADALSRRILGEQKRQPNVVYRLLEHCVQCPVTEGLLLYNNMTKELLLLSPEEKEHINELDELIAKWFLVPENQDDRILADQLREIAACLRNPLKTVNYYTIFTTMDCNARCFYCFERGRTRTSMSKETALQTVKYIIKNCGGEKVYLHWFGGEPLYNPEVIDIICRGLAEAGIDYRSRMTSNSYLFDIEMIKKAVELWKLKRVQITIDGTKEVYNRTKAYINSVENPYDRVMNNIKQLLDAGISVMIRLNLGAYNGEDLFRLVDELAERFKDKKGFNVYTNIILEQEDPNLGEYGWNQNAELYGKLFELRKHIAKHFGRTMNFAPLRHKVLVNGCMADNDGAVTILPGGELGRCEHFSESQFFGHINSENRNESIVESWKEKISYGPECNGCTCYSECIRLKKCPSGKICIPEERKELEEQLRLRVLNEYSRFLKQQTSDDEEQITFC